MATNAPVMDAVRVPPSSLDDVAIEEQRMLAEFVHLSDSAQRAANEALDLLRAATGMSLNDFTRSSGQRGARQHRVLRCDPAFAGVAQELGNRVLQCGSADDAGIAQFNQTGAFGGRDEVRHDVDRPHLFGRAIVGAVDHKRRLYLHSDFTTETQRNWKSPRRHRGSDHDLFIFRCPRVLGG